MKLTFCGAARQVTGSMYLLEADDFLILVDCGYDFDQENDNSELNTVGPFPFDPSMVDVVVLTHAHIDHSGKLPLLYKYGFEGQILCTDATYNLTSLLLYNSAELNNRKAKRLEHVITNKKKRLEFAHEISLLYSPSLVDTTLDHFVPIAFNQKFKISDNVSILFNYAGHLLGAAHVVFYINENGTQKSIGFSGDIGRKNYPLLKDPAPMPKVDHLVCETTYGNRLHSKGDLPENQLLEVIKKACVDTPGRLIIPSFSVGRTQALLFALSKLCEQGKLPRIKVFSDSPMALSSSMTYQKHISLLNQEAKDFFKENESLFDFENLIYVKDSYESKKLSTYSEPCIIISSSGMIKGGRVEHHVFKNLGNPYSTILIVGYCAEGTMGHELLQGKKEIQVKDKVLKIEADIRSLDCFSAHGDQADLLDFVGNQSPKDLKSTFLVHGSYESMLEFKAVLTQKGYQNIISPVLGEIFEL